MSKKHTQTLPNDVAAFVDSERGKETRSGCIVLLLREVQRLRTENERLWGVLECATVTQAQVQHEPVKAELLEW